MSSDSESENQEINDPVTYILPVLYSKDKSGRMRLWKIYTRKNLLYKTHGLVDGKLVTSKREIEGVNKGKKNETTATEQAKQEAERDWTTQVSKNFHCDKKDKKGCELEAKIRRVLEKSGGNINDARKKIRLEEGEEIERKTKKAQAKKVDKGTVAEIQKEMFPMHATKFEDKATVLKHLGLDKEGGWCYCQPKFDGNRAIIRLQNESDDKDEDEDIDCYKVVITTRTSKQYAHLLSLREEIKKFLWKVYKKTGKHVVLDGELYSHIIYDAKGKRLPDKERFQELSKMCKTNRSSPSPLEDQLCYYVYDIVNLKKNMTDRLEVLTDIFEYNTSKRIFLCKTEKVKSMKDIQKKHTQYTQEGYEGIILRARDLMYVFKHRSLKMRKYKDFDDAEFIIVDATQSEGTEEGLVIWVCETESGDRFSCRPRGTFEERKEMYENKEEYIGKLLTVRYQGMSKDNLPRFPVGIGIRDLEEEN